MESHGNPSNENLGPAAGGQVIEYHQVADLLILP